MHLASFRSAKEMNVMQRSFKHGNNAMNHIVLSGEMLDRPNLQTYAYPLKIHIFFLTDEITEHTIDRIEIGFYMRYDFKRGSEQMLKFQQQLFKNHHIAYIVNPHCSETVLFEWPGTSNTTSTNIIRIRLGPLIHPEIRL